MASRVSNKQQQEQRPPAESSQFASHGRGGAGNMADARKSPQLTPSDLETPVLKEAVVTTGRGGTGNMARNDDPVETRMRQDVEGYVRVRSSPLPPSLNSPQTTPASLAPFSIVTRGPLTSNSTPLSGRRVPRRLSSGAQHAGRGGAGNVFRDGDDVAADSARAVGREQPVIDDVATDGADPDSGASKGRKWLLGKKA